jgi:hypothetical protein
VGVLSLKLKLLQGIKFFADFGTINIVAYSVTLLLMLRAINGIGWSAGKQREAKGRSFCFLIKKVIEYSKNGRNSMARCARDKSPR